MVPDEHLDGAIVGPFHILEEIASWKLTRLPMVTHALAAKALPGARLVGTVALHFVWLDFTLFHIRSTFAARFTSLYQDDDGVGNAGRGALDLRPPPLLCRVQSLSPRL